MTPLVVAAILVAFLAYAVWTWVRLVKSVYQWLLDRLVQSRELTRPASSAQRDHDPSALAGPQRPGSVRPALLSSPPRADGSKLMGLAALPLGTALDPDFDAFFGGFEAALVAGFILVVAVVVVTAIRKIVSF